IWHFNRVHADGCKEVTNGLIVGDAVHNLSGVAFTHCDFTSTGAAGIKNMLSIKILTDNILFSDVRFYEGGSLVIGAASAEQAPKEIRFVNGFMDGQKAGEGLCSLEVNSCENLELCNFSVDSGTGNGILVGPNAQGFRMIGGSVRAFQKSGIKIAKGSEDTLIQGVIIADNNQENEAFGHGITVEGATERFALLGNTIRNKFGKGNGK